MRKCIHCGELIPERRLAVLPHTQTCVKCSQVKPKLCLQIYSGKHTSDVVIVDAENKENVRQAWNAYARARARDFNPVKKHPLRKCFE